MSYINKKGKTSAVRKMITRQQIADVLTYGQITTTHAHAKTTQVYLERLITLAKKDTLEAKRKAAAVLLTTKNASQHELLKKLFQEIAPNYAQRNGGYTRVLKLGKRDGDNVEHAVLQLV